jgi:RNase adaptor protein for sRNA GlmZ degradation
MINYRADQIFGAILGIVAVIGIGCTAEQHRALVQQKAVTEQIVKANTENLARISHDAVTVNESNAATVKAIKDSIAKLQNCEVK